MTPTANQLAAALREHIYGPIEGSKLHRLLYYIQGHHLALFGRPAFAEAIIAGPDGPEVEGFTDGADVEGEIGQGPLNVALLVATRYGQLTPADLDRLTKAEPPWRDADPGAEISHEALTAFFRGEGAQRSNHPLLQPNPERRAEVRAEVARLQAGAPTERDDLDAFRARVGHRADNLDDLLAKLGASTPTRAGG